MRFVGIDVAAEHHVVAVVDETGAVGLTTSALPVTRWWPWKPPAMTGRPALPPWWLGASPSPC
jgi:hypothetical protein